MNLSLATPTPLAYFASLVHSGSIPPIWGNVPKSKMYGQVKVKKCKVTDKTLPKYRIGIMRRAGDEPPALLLYISVKPEYINRADMVRLADDPLFLHLLDQLRRAVIADVQMPLDEGG